MSSIFHSFDYKTSAGVADDTTHYNYVYSAETGNLAKLNASGAYFSGEIIPTYDKFGRTENKTIDFSVNGSKAFYNKLIFDYVTDSDSESVLVSQLVSQVGKTSSSTTSTTYNYTYDDNGNITQIANASGVIQNKYYYDSLGQLIREDNLALNSTYTYSYDNAGNITSKKRYAFTTGTLGSVLNSFSYTYGDSTWGDLLTNYNGESISYDTIGNPTSIGGDILTWQGRELTHYENFDCQSVYFEYNANGIRTSKTFSDAMNMYDYSIEYMLNGSQIIGEHYSYSDCEENYREYTVIYIYDETGSPIGMKYREPSYAEGVYDCYFFEKNLQGDIIAIYNSNGTKIGTYVYDAWGNVTATATSSATTLESSIVTEINPFRYRGYYYDSETGWYYLQSRYYNPEWGRFLNADGYLSTGTGLIGYNMFAYCNNNPIAFVDSSGQEPISITVTVVYLFGIAICAILALPAIVDTVTNVTEALYEASVEFCESVNEVTNSISEKIDQLNEDHPGEYYVYTLKDSEGNIRYVGRTKDLQRRLNQHKRHGKNKDLRLAYYYAELTWAEARGLEEYEMIKNNTKYTGNNSIRGISPGNPNLIPYTFAADNYIKNKFTNYLYELSELFRR